MSARPSLPDDLIGSGPRWCDRLTQIKQNPAATDAGMGAASTKAQPAKREALGAELPATNSCDCPGCAPRARRAPRYVMVRADLARALDALAVANATRFAGLNTPDRKQMGAAQAVRSSPFTEHQTRPPPSQRSRQPARVSSWRAPAHPFPPAVTPKAPKKEAADGQACEEPTEQAEWLRERR